MTHSTAEVSPALPARFDHARNINVGSARVIWAMGCVDMGGRAHPPGWVTPGGARTQDETRARAVALEMDRLIAGAAKPSA